MEKTYAPHSIEQRWYQTWEEKGYFAAQTEGESYCIMIPPPNVTGSLHMGHAFQDTIMDALTRYNRMKGYSTLWQPGTDHAGIATQMVVERLCNAEGKTRHDYGREKFLEKVWQWKDESGGTITRQLRRMGSSLDWEKERFTMDDGMSDAVQEVFIQLYDGTRPELKNVILIGSSAAPTGWQHTVVNLSTNCPEDFSNITRVLEILENNETTRMPGRRRYSQYQKAGIPITTHHINN